MAQELLRAVQENKMSELSQHLDKKSKQKMDTIEKSEQPYLKTSVWTLAKNRIIWLLILMISATVTGAIIQGFEDVLQSVVILASFIPMLMDTADLSYEYAPVALENARIVIACSNKKQIWERMCNSRKLHFGDNDRLMIQILWQNSNRLDQNFYGLLHVLELHP